MNPCAHKIGGYATPPRPSVVVFCFLAVGFSQSASLLRLGHLFASFACFVQETVAVELVHGTQLPRTQECVSWIGRVPICMSLLFDVMVADVNYC